MTNPAPSTESALLHAILAMDSYNRGYDAAVLVTGSTIGDVTVMFDSSSSSAGFQQVQNLLGNYVNADEHYSFYAVAYSYTDPDSNPEVEQTIISYRGSDNFSWVQNPLSTVNEFGDVVTGYSLVLGDYRATQADMALGFYQSVVGATNVLSSTNVSLTGHSLGGGLAGFVGGMYDQKAIVFSQMPYESGLAHASHATNILDPEYDATYTQQVYGSLNPIYPSIDKHHAYSIYGEALSYVRAIAANNTDHTPLSLSIDDSEVDLVPYYVNLWDEIQYTPGGVIWSYLSGAPVDPFGVDWQEVLIGLPTSYAEATWELIKFAGFEIASALIDEAVARHSQSTMALRLSFQKQDEDASTTADWMAVGKYFWPVLYNNNFADAIGAHQYGISNEREQFADIMRTVLAYSAVEANDGLVFGNTGARALHDDANDLARALTATGASDSIENYAEYITEAFVHYATDLAISKVAVDLESTALDYRKGILEYDTSDTDTLVVNFKDSDWLPIYNDLKQTFGVTRDALVEDIFFDYYFSSDIDLDAFIMNNSWLSGTNLPGESSGEVFNRVIFAALDSGSTEYDLQEVEESFKGTLYVGSIGNDTVTMEVGSDDRGVFLGNGGSDSYFGGDDLDIAIGGSGQDVFDGGGSADFLYGGGDIDVLVGGLGSDIVIGGTGNDIFIADINGEDVYHGGYDQDDLVNAWNYDPFDIDDIDRASDGTDTVNYSSLTGTYFDITVLDAALGNYWVDKYYGNSVFNGTNDRDTLFSIETILGASGARQVGGTAVYGTGGYDGMNYQYYGGYTVAHNYYALGGNDLITAGFENDFLDGGQGDDTLTGNKGSDNYFYRLGDGQDLIKDLGTQGDFDVLMFDASILASEVEVARYANNNMRITFVDDTYLVVYNQNSPYGIDAIKFADGTYWDMQGKLVPVYGTEQGESLYGTDDSSYREGSLIHDLIYGYGGNDYIVGDTGNDTIYGGTGSDTINGNSGNYYVYGEDGVDIVNAGDGSDVVYGGVGADDLRGDDGNDFLYGGSEDDTIRGGTGNDVIYGGADGDSLLDGGDGNDLIYGEGGNDTIKGYAGTDVLLGGDNDDTIYGGIDNDTIYGDAGNDTLRGENNNDILYGGDGIDQLYGGLGHDTFVFESATAFNNIDAINDFTKTAQNNDKIDISSVLFGFYDFGEDVITDFVQIVQSGAHSLLSVDQNGGADNFVQIASLLNTSGLTDEAALESSGNLITHV